MKSCARFCQPITQAGGKFVVTFLITAVGIIAGLTFVAMANTWWAGRVRRGWLREDYPDFALRERIAKREIWPGMTRQQLLHSQDEPLEREERVEDGKTVEILKWDKLRDRYLLWVWLQDGLVTRFERNKS
jgi:hypothetical protein